MPHKDKMKLLLNRKKTIGFELSKLIQTAETTSIAVAYLTKNGLQRIIDSLKSNQTVRILCGTHGYISDVEYLNELSSSYPNIKTKVFNQDRVFHTKIYITKQNDSYNVVMGSANLTSNGLDYNEEACLIIPGELNSEFIKSIIEYYDELWDYHSITTKEFLELNPNYSQNNKETKPPDTKTNLVFKRITNTKNVSSKPDIFIKKIGVQLKKRGIFTIPFSLNGKMDKIIPNTTEFVGTVGSSKIVGKIYSSENTTSRYYQFYPTKDSKIAIQKYIKGKSQIKIELDLSDKQLRIN